MVSDKKTNTTSREVLLSTKEAAAFLQCDPDYIGRLCREGRIDGVQTSKGWLITPRSVKRFDEERIAQKAERAKELARERHEVAVLTSPVSLRHASIALALSLVLGAATFSLAAITKHDVTSAQSAALARVDSPFFATYDIGGFFASMRGTFANLFIPNNTSPVSTHTAPVSSVATTTIVNNYTTSPVVERIVERIVAATTLITDTGSYLALDGLRLNLNCTSFSGGGKLTTDASGNVVCDNDRSGGGGSGGGGASTFSELTGTLGVTQGGTGLTVAPSDGQLLLGNASGGYDLVATSSLGITGVTRFVDLDDAPNALTTGDLLYASAANTLSALSVGSNGQVLKLVGGVPTWSTDLQGSGGAGLFATTSDALAIYPVDPSYVVLFGNDATTTTGNILEVTGNALFRGTLTNYNTITAPSFVATSTTAISTFINASTTALSATTFAAGGTATTSIAANGALTIQSLSGLLKATAGLVSAATAGVDYENPLTFSYPLSRSGDTITLAFGTTTSNTWAGTQTFTNAPVLSSFSGLVAANSGATYQTATGTVSGSSQISVTAGQYIVGGGLTIDIVSDSIGDTQLAFNTGQHLTTASTPTFSELTVTNGITLGSLTTGNATTTNATTTNIAVTGTASTTNLTISGVLSSLLKTSSTGAVSAAVAGVDYLATYDAWTHPSAGVSATTSGLIISASSTINSLTTLNATSTYATTTGTLVVTGAYASTTNFFANGLTTCQSNNVLTWANGVFGCEADDSGSGSGADPFPSASTSTLLTFEGGLISQASSTILSLTTINSTSTNATTTNLYVSGLASTTNLNANSATIGSLVAGSLTIDSITLGSLTGVVAANSGATYATATGTVSGSSQISVTSDRYVIGGSLAIDIVGDSIGDTQLAFNTGQDLTTASTPTFSALTVTNALTSGSLVTGNATTTNATTTGTFAVTGSYASTTNFFANGLTTCQSNNVLTWANGVFGCEADDSGGSSFGQGWEMTGGYLAPTTTLGVILSASSTIGSGTQAGGLTVSGGATTTGNAYFAGDVGIGTSTPYSKLTTWGTDSLFEAVNNSSSTIFSIGQGGATTTALSVSGTASTTNLVVSGLAQAGSQCITSNSVGLLSLQSCANFDYPFPSNATSTALTFSGGITTAGFLSTASSTINGNLVITGNSTTTNATTTTLAISGLTASRAACVTTGGSITTSCTSAFFTSSVTDETGSGAMVFATAPTLTSLTVSSGGIAVTGNSTITGTLTGLTGLSSSGNVNFSALTASRLVATDASENLVSTITASNLVSSVTGGTIWHSANDGAGSGLDADTLDGISSASFLQSASIDTCAEIAAIVTGETGTCGSLVLSASPTFTGTVSAAAIDSSGTVTADDFWLNTGGVFVANGSITANNGLTVASGGISVSANGLSVTGNSSIAGTLISLTGLTTSGTASFSAISASGLSAAASGNVTVCINDTSKVFYQGGSNTNCNSSSERYKNTIEDSTAGLETLVQLRPRTFYYNEGDGREYLGFIAEEVNEVDSRPVTFNKEGLPNALDYSQFTPIIVKSLQQLSGGYTLHNLGVGATSSIASWYQGTSTPAITIDADGTVRLSRLETSQVCFGDTCLDSESNVLVFATSSVEDIVASSSPSLANALEEFFAGLQDFAQVGVRELGIAVRATAGIFDSLFTQTLTAVVVNAEEVNTKKLCIDDVCITKQELQALLGEQDNGNDSSNSSEEPEPSLDEQPETPAEEQPETLTEGDTTNESDTEELPVEDESVVDELPSEEDQPTEETPEEENLEVAE